LQAKGRRKNRTGYTRKGKQRPISASKKRRKEGEAPEKRKGELRLVLLRGKKSK